MAADMLTNLVRELDDHDLSVLHTRNTQNGLVGVVCVNPLHKKNSPTGNRLVANNNWYFDELGVRSLAVARRSRHSETEWTVTDYSRIGAYRTWTSGKDFPSELCAQNSGDASPVKWLLSNRLML